MMAAFSAAIASSVSPRMAVWSSPTPVMTATLGDDDARGVPAAAEADLEHGDLDAALAEEPERGGGEQLELGEAGGGAERPRAAQARGGAERGLDARARSRRR